MTNSLGYTPANHLDREDHSIPRSAVDALTRLLTAHDALDLADMLTPEPAQVVEDEVHARRRALTRVRAGYSGRRTA